MTGKTLAHYEIIDRIGQGGMGEVYRARDTKLGRDVAIKVLAEGVIGREDALARFEQEARAVAALSHPNIVALYELGSADVDGDTVVYAATELLEGRTLRDHLVVGAVPLRKAIEWTTQICKGLSAAHEKGIIHRDIKPENLFVTRDGHVKILDFGLARPAQDPGDDGETLRMSKGVDTAPGTVMGTVGYMSPEQVRAEPLEHTSDVFSLGTVLYEMLSGQRAFERDTSAETMTAILREDPPELRQVNESVPPGLDWIVRRCLEKSAHERFQSAHDLGLALQSVSTSSFSASEIPADTRAGARGGARTGLWALAVIVALVAGVVGGNLLFGPSGPASGPEITMSRLTYDRGRVYAARFADDERTVVYSAAVGDRPVEVFLKQIGTPGSRALELPPSTSLLSVSRTGELAVQLDSRHHAHFLRMGTFARAPLAGGAPRAVRENVMWMDWSPVGDEYAIVVRGDDNRDRLEFPAGTTLYETINWIGQISISPDGERIAFLKHPEGRYDDGGMLAVVDREGNVRDLSESYWSTQGVAWSPDGSEIWFGGGNVPRAVRAVDLDGNMRQVAGTFMDLTVHDIDAAGRVLVSEDVTRRGISLVDLATGDESDLSWLDQSMGAAISHDGRQLLFTEEGSQDASSIAVMRDLDGSLPVVLGEGYAFALSPDASEVLVGLNAPSRLMVHPTGTGQPRILDTDVIPAYGGGWTPDGHEVLFAGFDENNNEKIFAYDLGTGATRAITPAGVSSNARYPRLVISPDSKHVIALDRDGGVWKCNLSGDEPEPVNGVEAGETPVQWSADGRWLYVARMRLNRARVFRVDLETGARELWREIVPADPAGMEIYGILMTPDAGTLAYTYKRLTSDLYVVEGWR